MNPLDIEIFKTVPDIIERYKNIFPGCYIVKSTNHEGELCLKIINKKFETVYVEIRDCPSSKYYICEIVENELNQNLFL